MHKTERLILGISGSLRGRSSNTSLLLSLEELLPADAEFRMFEGLAVLPAFNPDEDGEAEAAHPAVRDWREALRRADAVVICTPEYARGVPGSLKNALDWAVSSGELMNKPTALISASPHPDGGATALNSLLLTVRMMSASVADEAVFAVPFVSKKLGPDGRISDPELRVSLEALVRAWL